MAALGRLLQIAGWVWLAIGFLGPTLNLPIRLDIFPGIILVFVARILRTQANRRERQEESEGLEQRPPPRRQPRPGPVDRAPSPPVRSPRSPDVSSKERLEPASEPEIYVDTLDDAAITEPAPESVETLVERMVLADGERMESPGGEAAPEAGPPKSSAEMIAEARRRWGARP